MGRDEDAALGLDRRVSYRRITPVTIRYGDQDPMGHVNNAVYAQWFEAARVPILDEMVEGEENLNTVLARLTIDYLRETHFPGTVDVGVRITAIGTRSVSSGYGIFRGEECVATSTCVNVFFDTIARRSVEPSARVRERVLQMIAETGAD